jgi:hypothetical protein
VVVALVLASIAAAAPTARVAVTDTALSPARVRIDAGGSVTWRNAGTRSHRIVSATRAFAAFTLAPRASRMVRFARNGAHRYTVDGRRCGIVYVGVPLGRGCPAGGGSGSAGSGTGPRRPPQGTRTYRYDVTARGEITSEWPEHEFQRVYRKRSWTSTFANVPLTVVTTGSTFFGTASGLARTGTRLTEEWRWFESPIGGSPGVNCEGQTTVTAPNFGLTVSIRSGRTNLHLSTGGGVPAEVFGAIASDCSGRQPYEPPEPDEFVFAGIAVDGSFSPPQFAFERQTGGLTSPVGELATGRAFSLDSRTVSTANDLGVKISQRYVVSFTPRR